MLSAEQYGDLLEGARITLLVSALAVLWGTAVALVLGVASLSPLRPLRILIRAYVELIRGVSAIILIFWTYYALPLFDVFLSPLQAGVLALGLNLSAYGTELVRGAVQAVPRSQTEAAIAVNLSGRQRLWSVVLPQAMVGLLPPYGNLVIEIMKASALVSLISLSDLTYEAQNMRILRTADSIDAFGAALVVYFAISLAITGVVRLLEWQFGRGLDTGRRGTALETAK